MQHFTDLFLALDQTNKTNEKVAALVHYLHTAPEEEKLWAIALLSGKRPKRGVRSSDLRAWAAELSALPEWLFEETYHIVGDLAETIAKILPPNQKENTENLNFWIALIQELPSLELSAKKERILWAWDHLDAWQRFVFHKMLMGGFRLGLSQKLTVRALAKYLNKDENELAHRLMGNWTPDQTSFEELLLNDDPAVDLSKPYPFYLAHQLDEALSGLGSEKEWQAEWKWDGIRGQLVLRGGEAFVWSRGEELQTGKFPELEALAEILPDGTVLDGEILPFKEGILPFQELQTRIGRKNLSKKLLEKCPVVLRAYDLLEWDGEDLRSRALSKRREILSQLIKNHPHPALQLSEAIDFKSWEELSAIRAGAREIRAEGLMLKRKDSPYRVGRKRGDWWKWKLEPLTVDAVMIYAMRGHGRRANLYTDYTFAVWDGEQLVPFTKAYSGLTDAEFKEVDRFVKQNTVERFGPVRSVKPALVFEIAFEGIQKSTRHKSGIALRFPRMKRWRRDKPLEEANTLQDLHALLEQYG